MLKVMASKERGLYSGLSKFLSTVGIHTSLPIPFPPRIPQGAASHAGLSSLRTLRPETLLGVGQLQEIKIICGASSRQVVCAEAVAPACTWH